MDVIMEIEKLGLTVDTYENISRMIDSKKAGIDSIDWSDVADELKKYDIVFNKDSIRKANDTIFGGYFRAEYEKSKKTKMSDIKDIIGELDIKKQELKTKTSQFNKIKKGFIKSIEIANDIKEEMYDNGFKVVIPNYCKNEVEVNSNNKMIVHITDWHIGLTINNCKGNYFNLEIAKNRINQLCNEIAKQCEFYDINEIKVVSTGDMIEHCYMRNNQHQNTEFNQSVQINECINLMYTLLVNLCEFAKVDFYSLSGNHDRTVGDKGINTEGDNANTIVTEQLYNYNEIAKNKRLTIHKSRHDAREILIDVDGLECKFIHGDERIKDGRRLIENDFSMDNCSYDILFRGHWHNYSITSENHGRYIVNTGCLSGFNDYSIKFGCATRASQTICVVSNGEVELIKDVILK